MKYNKYDMGSYNLHIIKTDKFKTITIRANFKRKLTKEEITYRSLLADVLFESSKKYPTKRDLVIATEELYNLIASRGTSISGNYNIMSFNVHFLNEKYTEIGMFEKSFSFLTDMIFDPDIKNNSFLDNKLEIIKKSMEDNIKMSKTNPGYYASRRLLETMGKNEIYSYDRLGYMEDLQKITGETLYEYYKQVINSDLIDIFIVGDVKDDQIKKIVTEKFKINTIKKPGVSHIYEHEKLRKRARILKEEYDSKQSQLMIGAKIGNLTDFERKYVGTVYSYILGGNADSLLFREVREKNSLCYSIYSQIRLATNLLIITAGIDKDDYNKTVKLIRREINNILKGNFDDSLIEKVKINYLNALDELEDSPFSILENYVAIEYVGIDEVKERIKNINKVNKQMVVDFAKKIHLDTIFLLEGGLE